MGTRAPRPPASAGEAGRRLWRAVHAEYTLTGADAELLRQAVTLADEAASLADLVSRVGPLIRNRDGDPVPNPAAQQHRLVVIALARLLAAVQVIGDQAGEHDPARPQRRSGVRGVYTGGLRAVE